jgi:hypothetical protein
LETITVYATLPPEPTEAGPLFETETSDPTTTVVFVVAVLFDRFGSVSVVVAFAVFVIVVPFVAAGFTRTTIWKSADEPAPKSALLQVIVPVAPTAGVEHANAGPEVCDSDTNVVFAGTASVRTTLCAPVLPTFETVTVYVMFAPAWTGFGLANFVTASPAAETVTFAVELLFASVDSDVVVDTSAVFEIVVLARLLVLFCTTIVNVALPPEGSDAVVQLIVPVPPAGGFVHANVVGPGLCMFETKVVPVGMTSVIATLAASLGPLLLTVTV